MGPLSRSVGSQLPHVTAYYASALWKVYRKERINGDRLSRWVPPKRWVEGPISILLDAESGWLVPLQVPARWAWRGKLLPPLATGWKIR
jgi:hypothetical protein